jgi:integrase/recombinase XerD
MSIKINVVENYLKNNIVTVTLDTRRNGVRTQKRLDIRYVNVPRNANEREDKKAKRELIKKVVAKMQIDALYADFILDSGYDLSKNFFDYGSDFMMRKAPVCEIRTYRAVLNKLKAWYGKNALPCAAITEGMLIEFKDYLEAELNGVSAYNYFKKLKRIINEAVKAKHFKKDPAENIFNRKSKCING